MDDTHSPAKWSDRPATYQIRVQGRLDPEWAEWFDGLVFTYVEDETVLTGQVTDQAALHSLINKLRDLGLTLLLVQRVDPGQGVEASGEAAPPPPAPVHI